MLGYKPLAQTQACEDFLRPKTRQSEEIGKSIFARPVIKGSCWKGGRHEEATWKIPVRKHLPLRIVSVLLLMILELDPRWLLQGVPPAFLNA
jgi:hypothetical protein